MIGGSQQGLIMLDKYDRVSAISDAKQGSFQPTDVVRMQASRGFVEDVE